MVKVCDAPEYTVKVPLGLMMPPGPAEALMVLGLALNDAAIVWLAATLLKVYVAIAPLETPSTVTSASVKPSLAAMVKVWDPLGFTVTVPAGLTEPPGPAEVVMV